LKIPQTKLFVNHNYLLQFQSISGVGNDEITRRKKLNVISAKSLMEKRVLKLLNSKDNFISQIESCLGSISSKSNFVLENPFDIFKIKSFSSVSTNKNKFSSIKNNLKKTFQIMINIREVLLRRKLVLQKLNKTFQSKFDSFSLNNKN
jgi:hypothetical protein